MDLQAEWRKTIEEHFDLVKIQAMSRSAAAIAALPLDRVLQKFDLGAVEHKGEDLTKLDPVSAFEEEMIDGLCYAALSLHVGQG